MGVTVKLGSESTSAGDMISSSSLDYGTVEFKQCLYFPRAKQHDDIACCPAMISKF